RGGEEVHLGPRVLRSRLAGSVAVAVVLARLGELDAAVATPPVGAETSGGRLSSASPPSADDGLGESPHRARQRPEE
ncbi:MAG TPA: hypothetical protein VH134_06040, partial [Candidatus Dormibacteraeota bacterium]|nr:hypothetical protein [Candidatus Dormibacteraeota bacterium]